MFHLDTELLHLVGEEVRREPAGPLDDAVRRHLRGGDASGLVVLGAFGSGKTSLCSRLAEDDPSTPPCTVVPLAVLGRADNIECGLRRVIGATRLQEARQGQRVLLLDGLDEVPLSSHDSYDDYFRELTAQVGPRWVLTSRPGHFRTASERADEQADSLERADVQTLMILPMAQQTVRRLLVALPRGRALVRTVEGLEHLASSPLLMHIIRAAVPYIEPGRPIDAWGLFDAWLRHGLNTGAYHAEALVSLERLAWTAFRDSGFSTETMSFPRRMVSELRLPVELQAALMVTELDGRVRFGHRSVFEYLIAAHVAPRLAANQGKGPDELSGLQITDATRTFLVGRVPRMPVAYVGDKVRIPRGNFVAGGALSPDERPLRIQHLAEPVWISRVPVTGAAWSEHLQRQPDNRQDANYLPHWGAHRELPAGHKDLPVFSIWPEDADHYAATQGARLPTADEWEKAVRGIDGRRWPWGDHWRPGCAVTAELGLPSPMPVRALGAHGAAGLFSSVGGVFEYTSSPWRGREDRGRIVMGGCFTHPQATSRASLRLSHKLSGNLKAGLRLAWDAS